MESRITHKDELSLSKLNRLIFVAPLWHCWLKTHIFLMFEDVLYTSYFPDVYVSIIILKSYFLSPIKMFVYGTIESWPRWAHFLTHLNHLFLVINSSSNIIIYVAKVHSYSLLSIINNVLLLYILSHNTFNMEVLLKFQTLLLQRMLPNDTK